MHVVLVSYTVALADQGCSAAEACRGEGARYQAWPQGEGLHARDRGLCWLSWRVQAPPRPPSAPHGLPSAPATCPWVTSSPTPLPGALGCAAKLADGCIYLSIYLSIYLQKGRAQAAVSTVHRAPSRARRYVQNTTSFVPDIVLFNSGAIRGGKCFGRAGSATARAARCVLRRDRTDAWHDGLRSTHGLTLFCKGCVAGGGLRHACGSRRPPDLPEGNVSVAQISAMVPFADVLSFLMVTGDRVRSHGSTYGLTTGILARRTARPARSTAAHVAKRHNGNLRALLTFLYGGYAHPEDPSQPCHSTVLLMFSLCRGAAAYRGAGELGFSSGGRQPARPIRAGAHRCAGCTRVP